MSYRYCLDRQSKLQACITSKEAGLNVFAQKWWGSFCEWQDRLGGLAYGVEARHKAGRSEQVTLRARQ
jgi:hypothetical protein